MEVPWLFVHFSDAVSLSQSRRAAGFVPFAVRVRRRRSRSWPAGSSALAGRARRRNRAAARLARRLRLRPAPRRPALVTWFALIGGARRARRSALVVAAATGRASTIGSAAARGGALRAAGRGARLPPLDARRARAIRDALSPAARPQAATKVPNGAIVIAPVRTSYEIAAVAPRLRRRRARHRTSRTRRRTTRIGASTTCNGGSPRQRPGDRAPVRRNLGGPDGPSLSSPAMKVLLVSALLPAGGRRRRAAAAQVRDAPAGARDRDARARARTTRSGSTATTSCSRRRSRGCTARATSARRAASRPRSCTGRTGLERSRGRRSSFGRRLLVPDENVSWNLTAIPAAIRIVRSEGIDVVITTSPPSLGPPGRRRGASARPASRWVADLRDSLVAHPHRRAERLARAREGAGRARRRARSSRAAPTRSSRVSDAIADEMRERSSRAGPVVTIANGSDFDDFAGLEHRPSATGSGSRTPARSSASATRGRS